MTLAYWHWVILGLAMVALEIMIPGAFLLWIGIAALILGGIIFVFPLSLTAQLGLFGVLALLATVVGRKIIHFPAIGGASVTLNRRGQQFVGQTIVLEMFLLSMAMPTLRWQILNGLLRGQTYQ